MVDVPALLRRAAALLAVAAVLAACSADGAAGRNVGGSLTIATGGRGGVYDQYGTEYGRLLHAELPRVTVRTVMTAGSVDNLERIAAGTVQVAFATADTAYTAMGPDGPGGARLRAVARIYDEYIHVVVLADSPAKTLTDLRGLRVSTGQPRSSTELIAGRLLGGVGLSAERDLKRVRVGIDASVEQLRTHKIDAFFWSGGLPTPAIGTLAKSTAIRLLPLGDQVDGLRAKYGTFYRRAVVPSAAYAAGDTVTVGLPNYLVVSASVPDDLVYELTRVLFARREDLVRTVASGRVLDARTAIATSPIPLHPGAERYYREHKL